jgi:L-lactate utilization protein LutB
MEEPKKKKGFLGKFMSVLSGKPDQADTNPLSSGKFAPTDKEPVDLSFVKNFTASGGKFLYCEQEHEAYDFLKSIIAEATVGSVICHNSNLQSILKNAGVDYTEVSSKSDSAFCCDCEYLISFNGGIMICDHQTKGKKLEELPEVFVVIARTSQIVENLRNGLTGIRAKYKGNIPSNITTIHGLLKDADVEEKSSCTRDIYLLLLEDQL